MFIPTAKRHALVASLPYQSTSSYPAGAWSASRYLGRYESSRSLALRRLRYLTATFGHCDPIAEAERRFLANLRAARVARASCAVSVSE